jgi:hypothetical protein
MRVTATANFLGAKAGRTYTVDGDEPEVQAKLARGWFVLADPPSEPAKSAKPAAKKQRPKANDPDRP